MFTRSYNLFCLGRITLNAWFHVIVHECSLLIKKLHDLALHFTPEWHLKFTEAQYSASAHYFAQLFYFHTVAGEKLAFFCIVFLVVIIITLNVYELKKCDFMTLVE